jgi:hypothetical protein
MNGVEPLAWEGMEYALNRNPALGKGSEPIPGHAALLTATPKRQPPVPRNLFAKLSHAASVTRYRVVVEVSLNERSEPLASLLNRIVLAGEELLLDLPQLCSHPLARRLPQDHKAPLLARLPAQVRETEKVERLRFLLSTLFPISFGMSPEPRFLLHSLNHMPVTLDGFAVNVKPEVTAPSAVFRRFFSEIQAGHMV